MVLVIRGFWAMLCLPPQLGSVCHKDPNNRGPRITLSNKSLHLDKVDPKFENHLKSSTSQRKRS